MHHEAYMKMINFIWLFGYRLSVVGSRSLPVFGSVYATQGCNNCHLVMSCELLVMNYGLNNRLPMCDLHNEFGRGKKENNHGHGH